MLWMNIPSGVDVLEYEGLMCVHASHINSLPVYSVFIFFKNIKTSLFDVAINLSQHYVAASTRGLRSEDVVSCIDHITSSSLCSHPIKLLGGWVKKQWLFSMFFRARDVVFGEPVGIVLGETGRSGLGRCVSKTLPFSEESPFKRAILSTTAKEPNILCCGPLRSSIINKAESSGLSRWL